MATRPCKHILTYTHALGRKTRGKVYAANILLYCVAFVANNQVQRGLSRQLAVGKVDRQGGLSSQAPTKSFVLQLESQCLQNRTVKCF